MRFPQGPFLDDQGNISLEWVMWLQNPQFVSLSLGSALPVGSGGTGLISGTSGGILAFTGQQALASSPLLTGSAIVLGGGVGATPNTPVGLGTTTTVLHGNLAGNPSWSSVNLTSDVSGTLPVAHGGTGAVTLAIHGVVIGNTTGAVNVTAAGASNTVLHGNTGTDPTFTAVDLAADVTGNLGVSHLNSGTAAGATTFWRGDGAWAIPSGSGNVVGPASAVSGNVVLFDSTTGKLIKDGGTLGSNAFTSTAYLPLTGGTLAGNLLFTDASYDIGASGATRPRNLFLSGNATIGGTLGVTGISTLGSTVGIGTTPSAWGTNFKAVEATASSAFALSSGNINPLTLLGNAYETNANDIYTTTGVASRYEVGNGGAHRWSHAVSGTAGNPISWVVDMSIGASGGVAVTAALSAANITAWSAFTTTRTSWTDVGSPTVTARQCQIGNVCHFQIKVVPGTTVATVAGTSYCSLPITAAGIGGASIMTDTTTRISIGNCVIDVANSRVYVPTQTATADTLTLAGWYEI